MRRYLLVLLLVLFACYPSAHAINWTFPDNVTVQGVLTVPDNTFAPGKLQSSSGAADNSTFYRGDGAWSTPATDAIADNTVTPVKLFNTSGTPDNTSYYRGDGVWDNSVATQDPVISDNTILPAKLYTISGAPDNSSFYRGDGAWASGAVGMSELKDDLSPELGGQLNTLGKNIYMNSVGSYDVMGMLIFGTDSAEKRNFHIERKPAYGGIADNVLWISTYSVGESIHDNMAIINFVIGNAVEQYESGQRLFGIIRNTPDILWVGGNIDNAFMLSIADTGKVRMYYGVESTPINGSIIGAVTPAAGTFTTLTTTGATTHVIGENIPDDQSVAFGTGSDYLCGYDSATGIFRCMTTETGATITDTNGLFTLRANSANGTLDPGQRVFQVLNYNTPLAYVDDQGSLVLAGEITADQFNSNCSPTDNTCYANAADDGPPTSPVHGDHYYNRTVNRPGWYDNTAWRYLPFVTTENATFKTPTSGDKAKFRKPYGMTVSSVGCVTDAATSVVLDVQECNSSGASCTTILSSTITCGTTYGTGTISDSAIASGNYVFFSLGTVTGTPGFLYVDFNYTVTGG